MCGSRLESQASLAEWEGYDRMRGKILEKFWDTQCRRLGVAGNRAVSVCAYCDRDCLMLSRMLSCEDSGSTYRPLARQPSGCQTPLGLENGRWKMLPVIGPLPVSCVSRSAEMTRAGAPVAVRERKIWSVCLSPAMKSPYSGPSFQPRSTPSYSPINRCRETDQP